VINKKKRKRKKKGEKDKAKNTLIDVLLTKVAVVEHLFSPSTNTQSKNMQLLN
jgi:hypothetical protein